MNWNLKLTVECLLTCFCSSGVISWKKTLLAIEQATWIFLDDFVGDTTCQKCTAWGTFVRLCLDLDCSCAWQVLSSWWLISNYDGPWIIWQVAMTKIYVHNRCICILPVARRGILPHNYALSRCTVSALLGFGLLIHLTGPVFMMVYRWFILNKETRFMFLSDVRRGIPTHNYALSIVQFRLCLDSDCSCAWTGPVLMMVHLELWRINDNTEWPKKPDIYALEQ